MRGEKNIKEGQRSATSQNNGASQQTKAPGKPGPKLRKMGVSRVRGGWMARIGSKGRSVYLGMHRSRSVAIDIRRVAEKQYHCIYKS